MALITSDCAPFRNAVTFNEVKHGFAQNLLCQQFGYICVGVLRFASHVTVKDCRRYGTAFPWPPTAFPWPSLTFHCLSLIFRYLPLPFLGLPLPFLGLP